MCARLLAAGHRLVVWNRTRAKAEELGAAVCVADCPAEVARRSWVVFTSVRDDAALYHVLAGPGGVLEGAAPGALVVDTSTVSPGQARHAAEMARERHVEFLSAPVIGNPLMASQGRLTVLVSGGASAYRRSLSLLQVLGEEVHYVGGGQEACYLKLAVNLMIGFALQAVAEALLLGKTAGLDPRVIMRVVEKSVVASPVIRNKAPSILAGDFTKTFGLGLMLKDFDLALNAARELGIPLPVSSCIRELLQIGVCRGLGECDYSAMVLVAERIAGRGSVSLGPAPRGSGPQGFDAADNGEV